jgi:hypothetical protein
MFGTGADCSYCDEFLEELSMEGSICEQEEVAEMLTEWYGVSDVGLGVVDFDDSIRCIDDVVEKYVDALLYFDKQIGNVDEDIGTLISMQMENPYLMDFDTEFTRLGLDRIYYEETKEMLQKDLDRIRGVIPPWE